MVDIDLKKKVGDHLKHWKDNGGVTTVYRCPNCSGEIETQSPPKYSRDTWDSARTCIHCGEMHFAAIKSGNRVRVCKMPA